MPRVFISYRRDDSSGYARGVFDRLSERFGQDNVFMDLEIAPGEDFVERIQQAIGSCDVLITLIGRSWLTVKDAEGRRRLDDPEDWARIEIKAGMDRQTRIVPVLVGGARMPTMRELPEALDGLARRQALEIRDVSYDYDIDRLIEAIARAAGEEPPPATTAAQRASGAKPAATGAAAGAVPGSAAAGATPRPAPSVAAPPAPPSGSKRKWGGKSAAIAAVVALVVVVGIVAVVAGGGSGDDGESSGGGGVISTLETNTGSTEDDFTEDYHQQFIASCTGAGSSETLCQCFYDGITNRFTREQADELIRQLFAGEGVPQELVEINDSCQASTPAP